MRISDWSSDVCSSDLDRKYRHPQPYRGTRARKGLAAHGRPCPRPGPGMARAAALLQRLAAVRGRLSLCADQAAAAKWWLSMPMASVSAEGPMPKALSTRRTSPLMPGCRHQGRRSEEPTSDLQSLMRISYAVFCLKKKKNDN